MELIEFFSRIIPTVGGCWLWSGPFHHDGYGRCYYRPGKDEPVETRAHRASYEIFRGKIPDGKIIRHHCDIRPCVHPDHIIPGTHQENSDDMISRGRHFNQLKVHCPAGHFYTEENTYVYEGWRRCKQCQADRVALAKHHRDLAALDAANVSPQQFQDAIEVTEMLIKKFREM